MDTMGRHFVLEDFTATDAAFFPVRWLMQIFFLIITERLFIGCKFKMK